MYDTENDFRTDRAVVDAAVARKKVVAVAEDKAFLNRNLYFHYARYRVSMPHSVIISGQSKVIHFYERPDIRMSFDLSNDPGEVSNIAKQNPEIHKKLYDEMMRYLKEVGLDFQR